MVPVPQPESVFKPQFCFVCFALLCLFFGGTNVAQCAECALNVWQYTDETANLVTDEIQAHLADAKNGTAGCLATPSVAKIFLVGQFSAHVHALNHITAIEHATTQPNISCRHKAASIYYTH